MDLFATDPNKNLLPGDGTVHYHGPVMAADVADGYLAMLYEGVPWRHDQAVMFGKHIVTARKVAWYGDTDFPYTYSGTTKTALPWTLELLQLKSLAERLSAASFNSCLLNLYSNGREGMGWHSDDEQTMVPGAAIASMSFGAERRFCFKPKSGGDTISVELEHGSLLVMSGSTQKCWLHSLPKAVRVTSPRINLTFRQMRC